MSVTKVGEGTNSIFNCSLCIKCPNTELFLVRNFLYKDWIRRFTEQISSFSPNTGKYGPEITPYLDTFHEVAVFQSVFTLRHIKLTIYILKNKFTSYKEYSLNFVFPGNPKKSHTDQVCYRFFHSVWKKTRLTNLQK